MHGYYHCRAALGLISLPKYAKTFLKDKTAKCTITCIIKNSSSKKSPPAPNMPPSQLKQLKESLKQNGLSNTSKPKKKKARHSLATEDRLRRDAALGKLREDFRPFDKKVLSRPKKFQALSLQSSKNAEQSVLGRPGVSKSRGEELVCRKIILMHCIS